MRMCVISTARLVVAVATLATANLCAEPGQAIRIEQLMAPATFRKAGLDQLSSDQLRTLNAWLAQYTATLRSDTNAASAAERTRKPADVIERHISGAFEGWSGETIFKLDNGQIWQQASYSYAYHYAYHPKVLIADADGTYKMQVEGMNSSIPVRRLVDVVESYIAGTFEGWDGDTVFKLGNGQIWKQASMSVLVHVAVNPRVLLYRSGGAHKMHVEGVSQVITVTRLK